MKNQIKKKPISYYSKKADKLLQELFRLSHTSCEVCGKPMSCAHHYYTKSSSGNLRYNNLNLISLCQGCHFSLHNGNPDIQNKINEVRGDKWLKELQQAKMIPNYQCNTKTYYEQKIEELKNEIKNYE